MEVLILFLSLVFCGTIAGMIVYLIINRRKSKKFLWLFIIGIVVSFFMMFVFACIDVAIESIDKKSIEEGLIEEIKIAKEDSIKEDSIKEETPRIDSLAYYELEAEKHKRNKNYNLAIDSYKKIFCFSPKNKDTINYQIALCYVAISDKSQAVAHLRMCNTEYANQLYEKINPVKKRIIGYVTLCCDGTTSNSRGRGACSRHGGVCNWNHPIYEEYREY